jgi:hypothetical protein
LFTDAIGTRTLRDAQAWFNESLPQIMKKSHQAIWDYARGAYPAELPFLYALRIHYPITDARHQLAVEIIELRIHAMRNVISPELSEGNGKKLLKAVKG